MATSQKAVSQFPWKLFHNSWREGITSAFVPKTYGGRGFAFKDTHIVANQMRQKPQQMKTILGAHLSAQIAMALGQTSENTTQRYYPLLVSNPTVSASHLSQESRQIATYRLDKHNNMVLSGSNLLFTNADVASFYMVEATPEDSDKSILCLLDKHQLGISLEKHSGDDHQRGVSFYDVLVPQNQVIICDNGKEIMTSVSAIVEEITQ